MKNPYKNLVIAFLMLAFHQVFAQSTAIENPKIIKSKGYEKTANPYTRFLYKNGFRNFSVDKVEANNGEKDITYYELRFHSVFSPLYTKKVMFDTFGKWTKEIENSKNEPTLVWKNVKLFKDSKETFTVFANGMKDFKFFYASVYVFDSKNKDALEDQHPMKNKIIKYFSEKIWNLSENKDFQTAYNQTNLKKDLKK